jgi:hypothetical protein
MITNTADVVVNPAHISLGTKSNGRFSILEVRPLRAGAIHVKVLSIEVTEHLSKVDDNGIRTR